jgi:flagellar hook-basal body complex protein FliE
MQISSINDFLTTAVKTNTSSGTGANFSDILTDALQNAIQQEASDKINTAQLLTGENTEIHDAMIQAQKAELALNLTIQIRNKVLDAYKEIMQMQV